MVLLEASGVGLLTKGATARSSGDTWAIWKTQWVGSDADCTRH